MKLERDVRRESMALDEQSEWESAVWWFQILFLMWSVALGRVYRLH